MSWTTKPKFDVRTFVHTACAAAEQRRQAAEPIPDAPYFQEEAAWHDGRIKLGRRSESWLEWLDWTDEDWWHLATLALSGFLTAFVATVLALTVR